MISAPWRRILLCAVLALLFAFLAEALPRVLPLTDRSPVAFLSARAVVTALLIFAGGLCMGAIDPERAGWWGLLVGSGPLLHLLLRVFSQRPPSLWPLAAVLAAAFGLIPAVLGTLIGRRLRSRAPPAGRQA
jgi:hypothetical protein